MTNANGPKGIVHIKGVAMPHTKETLIAIERDTALRNAVIDAALDCIIMMDQDGLVVEFNPAAEQVFGYTQEEAVGAKLSDLIIPDNLKGVHTSGLAKFLETGEHKVLNQRVEVPATNKAGDDMLCELAISPVEFDGTIFFSAYLRDITEARASQDRLRASEERFQSLFELSPDAIVVLDSLGSIVDLNGRACQLIGCEKDELLSKSALDFVPKDEIRRAVSGISDASNGNTVQILIEFLNARGERIPTEVLGREIKTEDGPLYYGVVRDISERLATEKQLRGAKEAAEKANAAKSDFLANMSHEMRTPLNGVIGSLSLIDRGQMHTETAGLIQSAERSAETMLTLIDDLLDLSRIEAGEVELETKTFDVKELSTLVVEVFGSLAEKKGIVLQTRVNSAVEQLHGDIGKIRQVLLNLVGNALKFTQRGHVSVAIDYSGEGDAGQLKVEVEDTGIGISKSEQLVLFDRFKQADSSRSKSHGGAGLGLSICKELVGIMQGGIAVTSAPGVGSNFVFKVPVTRGEAKTETSKSQIQGLEALHGRVLIAEDSETNAMVAKKMLDLLGLSYEHVVDGAAAVDAAIGGDFDIVLMDVSMPTMDGLHATRILRERGYEKPILAMTAHALRGDRDNAIESGMMGYLTKPVRMQALRESLSEWLDPAPKEPEVAEQPSNAGGLDTDAIDEVWAGDLETFAEICKIFLDELDWRIPALKGADLGDLEHHAHSLKGAASNIAANELSRLASELEMSARTGHSERIDDLVKRIDAESSIVCDALKRDYLAGGEHG